MVTCYQITIFIAKFSVNLSIITNLFTKVANISFF